MWGFGDFLLIFAVAAVVTFLACFPARRAAGRLSMVAQPGDHHVHDRPTPVVGGGAMVLAFVVAMLLAWRLPGLHAVFVGSSEPLGVVVAAVVIFAVGLVDDVRDISAPAKLAGQVLAAMVLVLFGVTMWYFKIPFDPTPISLSASMLPLVTALWVAGMANAVNFIDGLDGLAAGIIAIASASLCVYGLRLVFLGYLSPGTNELGPLIAAIACGVCVGFLPHNFHPARAFMGDAGSMLLGLLMAAATMLIGGRTGSLAGVGSGGIDVSGETFFRFAPLFIPFVILGVPILDTAFAIVRRAVRRTGVASRDLGHLHHRLIRLGHGHRRAVLVLWAWTAVLSGFVLYPTFVPRANAYVPFGAAFLGVALYTLFLPGRRSRSPALAAPAPLGEPDPDAAGGGAGHTPGAAAVAPGSTAGAPGTGQPPAGGAGPERGRTSVPVVISGAAGVAVAGAPDLPSPGRRRRRHARSRVPRLVQRRERIGPSEEDLPG